MSRPLRIELPGAVYHVTARGDGRQSIFDDDDDRQQYQPTASAQGAQIAQLERKTKGHSRGSSHSTTAPNGKTSSHQPGKGRTEKPSKSAAKNRQRDRMLQTNVANSIAKSQGTGK